MPVAIITQEFMPLRLLGMPVAIITQEFTPLWLLGMPVAITTQEFMPLRMHLKLICRIPGISKASAQNSKIL